MIFKFWNKSVEAYTSVCSPPNVHACEDCRHLFTKPEHPQDDLAKRYCPEHARKRRIEQQKREDFLEWCVELKNDIEPMIEAAKKKRDEDNRKFYEEYYKRQEEIRRRREAAGLR